MQHRTNEAGRHACLVIRPDSARIQSIKRARSHHTSSPSSSTTGFLTLIRLSEAIVRSWARFRVGVEAGRAAATREERERRDAEGDLWEGAEVKERRRAERGAGGVRDRRARAEPDRRANIVVAGGLSGSQHGFLSFCLAGVVGEQPRERKFGRMERCGDRGFAAAVHVTALVGTWRSIATGTYGTERDRKKAG